MEENKVKRKPSKLVYLASVCALFGAIGMGSVLGYTSPAVPDMNRTDSEPRVTDQDDDAKTWIGSSVTLGALVGALSSGPIAQLLGRRIALIGYGIPLIIGWFSIFSAKSVSLIIIGRVLTGIGAGLVSGSAPSYVVEISTNEIRGLLGAGFQLCVTIGILMVYVLGSFMPWNWLAFVCIFPGLLMSVSMFFMPETPIWLLTHSKTTDHAKDSKAANSLSKLRHNTNDNESEMNELVEQAKASKNSSGISVEQMKNPIIYKPFLLAMGLMFFQQFSGINAVMFYSTDIFIGATKSIQASTATIIIGVSQTIATVIGSLLVDRLGRKILLIGSGFGHAVSLGILGFYYMAKLSDYGEKYGWIPVASLVVFIVSFSLGYGPIPWLMIAEITPISARSMISAVATGFNWLCAFLITKNFEWLQATFTQQGTFFFFSVTCLISVAFVVFLLPETKGKSIEQILGNFEKKNNSGQSTPSASNTMLKSSDKGNMAGNDGSDKAIEMKRYADQS